MGLAVVKHLLEIMLMLAGSCSEDAEDYFMDYDFYLWLQWLNPEFSLNQ